MRVAFTEPGRTWNDPYHIIHQPLSNTSSTTPLLRGGQLDILRGGFSDRATLLLTAPLPFQHKDWVRVWLPGDAADQPTYLGEVISEPWTEGAGEVQLRGLTERLHRCRWFGKAEGDFQTFLTTVIGKATLPPGVTLGPLPPLTATFRADVPFELLGDTLSAIAPALEGYLVGVSNAGQITAVHPGTTVMHRFPHGTADTPPGTGDGYANCVRFSFTYPNGDEGWFEGMNSPEVAAGGEEWDVVQVTAREVGEPQQPFTGLQGIVTTTRLPGGLSELFVNVSKTGAVLGTVTLNDFPTPTIAHVGAGVYPGTATDPAFTEARRGVDMELSAHLTPPTNFYEFARHVIKDSKNDWLTTADMLAAYARPEVVLNLTAKTDLPPEQALVFGMTAADGTITWSGYGDGFNGANATHNGSWEAVPGAAGCYRFLFPTLFSLSVGKGALMVAYKPQYRDACLAAGMSMTPITFRAGGVLQIPTSPPSGIGAFVYSPHALPENMDNTVLHPVLKVSGVGEYPSRRVALPFPIFTAKFTAQDDPVTMLNTRHLLGGTALIDLPNPITVPLGSSVDVELLTPTGTVGSVMLLPDLSDQPTALSFAAERKAGLAESVAGAAITRTPQTLALLPRGENLEGWARFMVRADQTVQRLVLQGVTGAGRVRIRTPQLDTLTGYASELLRYRSQPVREWTGRYSTLKRVDALGVAAFEVRGKPADELLDVQRVSYDLTTLKVSVVAGSPLPATDEDAIAGRIERMERVQRRAGGTP